MFFGMPFLISMVPGVIVLFLTWWLRKKNVSLFIKLLPSIGTVISSFAILYVSLEFIRGFEGAGYGVLAFFLLCYGVAAYFLATKRITVIPNTKKG
ncbi:Zn-dependent protease with chaperone function [Fictibacillus halophilus]|uniref:Zn-dependent protease with chaperone function n=1 Tax=Fictibacillus halophilus TaxID=1610490 RepID=A0ABV2LE77_9BACL|nr:YesK family protein [Fictibacillus halophilus]